MMRSANWPSAFTRAPYRPEYGLEVVKVWRRAFQEAMGLAPNQLLSDVDPHLDFLASLNANEIQVAIDPANSSIAGFMAASHGQVHHLYIDLPYQQRGIGSAFVEIAKAASPAGVELYTFALNRGAQAFYRAQGFEVVARGYANPEDNPWATDREQLADVKLRWSEK